MPHAKISLSCCSRGFHCTWPVTSLKSDPLRSSAVSPGSFLTRLRGSLVPCNCERNIKQCYSVMLWPLCCIGVGLVPEPLGEGWQGSGVTAKTIERLGRTTSCCSGGSGAVFLTCLPCPQCCSRTSEREVSTTGAGVVLSWGKAGGRKSESRRK